MANPPRLLLEAYGELSLEPRQYVPLAPRGLRGCTVQKKAICKVETTKDIVDGLVDFYNLVFYFL